MKLPPDRFLGMAHESSTAADQIARLADQLLPWRAEGRAAGYRMQLTEPEFMRHAQARAVVMDHAKMAIQALEEAIKPPGMVKGRWTHWQETIRAISLRPEMLLEIQGEDFREFHVAMIKLGHVLSGRLASE